LPHPARFQGLADSSIGTFVAIDGVQLITTSIRSSSKARETFIDAL